MMTEFGFSTVSCDIDGCKVRNKTGSSLSAISITALSLNLTSL